SPAPYLRPVPRSSATFREAERLRMGGLDLLRAQLESPATRSPIDRLTGIRLLEAGEGRAVFAMHASDWLRNEFGSVYGGAVVLLAKSAAAAAGPTLALPDAQFTALGGKVDLLRPIAGDGGGLVATGTVMHRGRRLSIAAAEVMHGPHRVALATGTTAIFTP